MAMNQNEIQKPGLTRINGPISETNLVSDTQLPDLPLDAEKIQQEIHDAEAKHKAQQKLRVEALDRENERRSVLIQPMQSRVRVQQELERSMAIRRGIVEAREERQAKLPAIFGNETHADDKGRFLISVNIFKELCAIDMALAEFDKWHAEQTAKLAALEAEIVTMAKDLKLEKYLPADLAQ